MSRGQVEFFRSELEVNMPWHPFCSQHYWDILQHTSYTNALLSSPLAPSLLCQEGRGKAVRLSRHQWPSRRFSTCVMFVWHCTSFSCMTRSVLYSAILSSHLDTSEEGKRGGTAGSFICQDTCPWESKSAHWEKPKSKYRAENLKQPLKTRWYTVAIVWMLCRVFIDFHWKSLYGIKLLLDLYQDGSRRPIFTVIIVTSLTTSSVTFSHPTVIPGTLSVDQNSATTTTSTRMPSPWSRSEVKVNQLVRRNVHVDQLVENRMKGVQ